MDGADSEGFVADDDNGDDDSFCKLSSLVCDCCDEIVAVVSAAVAETTAAAETIVTAGVDIFSFCSVPQNAFQFRVPRVVTDFKNKLDLASYSNNLEKTNIII